MWLNHYRNAGDSGARCTTQPGAPVAHALPEVSRALYLRRPLGCWSRKAENWPMPPKAGAGLVYALTSARGREARLKTQLAITEIDRAILLGTVTDSAGVAG